MKLLEERIRKDGQVIGNEILKVDSFLNHQIDVSLYREMAKEWAKLYEGEVVTKVLTIESSGIGLAVMTADAFNCKAVFAKKSASRNVTGDVYQTKVTSFTHNRVYDVFVSKKYLDPSDRVLIVDDFLANGEALKGLIALVKEAGATLIGCGIAIEKTFQPGGQKLRAEGIRIESLSKVKSMSETDGIVFED